MVHDFDIFGCLVGARPARVASFGGRRIFTAERRDPPRTWEDGSAAYAYTPPQPGFSGTALNGDIWVDDQYKTDDASAGTFLYETFLHELGHALGLKHPFEGAALPAEFDNTRYTIMSYTEFNDSAFRSFALQGNSLLATTSVVTISTPMLLDIIAIQGIYGASNSAELGANTYTFDESRPMMMTLVDNGGVDTFDLSAHTRSSIVNLTPGAFSSIAQWSVASQIAFWTARFRSSSIEKGTTATPPSRP